MRLGGLNQHLHQIFDLAPDPVLGLRVNAGETGLGWAIVGDTLTLTPDGGDPQAFDLSAHTISSLGTACITAGFTVPTLNADLADRSAVCLLPGAGHSLTTNGDHLLATQSLTLLLLDALGEGVERAREDLLAALAQMWPLQAEGEWADYWGQLFGIWRRDNEADDAYTARIFAEVVRPRSNAFAIEANLSDALGETIRVFEPWTRVIYPSGHACTPSRHRIRGGNYWTHCIIHPSGAARDSIAGVIDRHRAAGVLVRYEDRQENALTSIAALSWAVLNTAHQGVLSSSQVLFLEGATPAGAFATGNEPVVWALKDDVLAHASLLADGMDHHHALSGLPACDVPSGWLLSQHVWVDAAEPPDEMVLGWHVAGDGWYYGSYGSDIRAESPKATLGPIPAGGAWARMHIDPADVGVSGQVDGLFFGLHSGRAWFGPSGAQIPLSATVFAELNGVLESGGFAYQISGVKQSVLFTETGVMVLVDELAGEYGEPLYRLDAPGSGAEQFDLRAGMSWPLGSLTAKGYRAGHELVDVTEATFVVGGSSISTDAEQVS